MVAAFLNVGQSCEFRLAIRFAAEKNRIVSQALWQCTGFLSVASAFYLPPRS